MLETPDAAGHEEHGGHFRLEVHFGEELRLVFLVEEDVVYRDAVGVDMLFRNAEYGAGRSPCRHRRRHRRRHSVLDALCTP